MAARSTAAARSQFVSRLPALLRTAVDMNTQTCVTAAEGVDLDGGDDGTTAAGTAGIEVLVVAVDRSRIRVSASTRSSMFVAARSEQAIEDVLTSLGMELRRRAESSEAEGDAAGVAGAGAAAAGDAGGDGVGAAGTAASVAGAAAGAAASAEAGAAGAAAAGAAAETPRPAAVVAAHLALDTAIGCVPDDRHEALRAAVRALASAYTAESRREPSPRGTTPPRALQLNIVTSHEDISHLFHHRSRAPHADVAIPATGLVVGQVGDIVIREGNAAQMFGADGGGGEQWW